MSQPERPEELLFRRAGRVAEAVETAPGKVS
jgi:hypothetical protein